MHGIFEIFRKESHVLDLLEAVHAGGGGPVPGLPVLPLPAAAHPGLDARGPASRHWPHHRWSG